MRVSEFCYKHTNVGELCVIRDSGWTRHTVWIDHEDIFVLDERYANREIKSTEWGTIYATAENGDKVSVPCHYIDV